MKKNEKPEYDLPTKPVRVMRMHVENYKRIELADLRPSSRITKLLGMNNNGKTSLAESPFAAIGGKRARSGVILRQGSDEGRIELDLGNDDIARMLEVELIFDAEGNERLEVRNADGVPQKSPQGLLDALIGPQRSQFDPLALLKLPRRELVEKVRIAMGLDFTKLDALWQETYDNRTLVGRELKSLEARLAALPRPSQDEPEPIDTTSLLKKQEELLEQQRTREALASTAREAKTKRDGLANEHRQCQQSHQRAQKALEEANASVERAKKALEEAQKAVTRETEALSRLTTQMGDIELRGKAAAKESEAALERAEQAPDPEMDLTMIRSQLEDAEKNTEAALKAKERERVSGELKGKEDEHRALDKQIAKIEAEKVRLIQEAAEKFAIKGIGFTGDEVTLDGLPLSQASQSQQVRFAVGLGVADKPLFRTMCVKEGSFLDNVSMRLFEDVLEEFDAYSFVEVVDPDGRGADGRGPCVVIKLGRIAEVSS
jgi:predicted ATP-dependent endonuclease of OLD family